MDRFIPLLLSSCVAIYLGFFHFDAEEAVDFVGNWGYWLIFIPSALLAANLGRVLLRKVRAANYKVKNARWAPLRGRTVCVRFFAQSSPALFILFLSSILLCSQPSGFKIVMDEPVLASTAQQMHFEREAFFFTEGYRVENIYYPHRGAVDKRPLFFPFLLSALHDLTGYRSNQGVVLNALLLPVFFALLYSLARRFCRPYGGFIAVGLFATSPLLIMNATSAGFDLLNLVMILAVGFCCVSYAKKPTSARLDRLLLLTVLLAHTRYESVLFIVPVAFSILYIWWRDQRIQITWTMVLVPLLLVVYPLQRLFMREYSNFWQLRDGFDVPFSLSFIPQNIHHAIDFLFSSGGGSLNSIIITISFLVLLLVSLLFCRWPQRHFRPEHMIWAGFFLIVLVNFMLLMAYHWGQLDNVVAARLALPLLLLMVVSIVGMFRWVGLPQQLQLAYLGAVSLFFLSVSRPALAQNDYLEAAISLPQVVLIGQLARGEASSALIISDTPLASSIELASSMDLETALNHLAALELHHRLKTFDEMWVVFPVFAIHAQTELIPKLKRLNEVAIQVEKSFDLDVREDFKVNDVIYLRVARIDSVRLGAQPALNIDTSAVEISHTGKMTAPGSTLSDFFDSLPR